MQENTTKLHFDTDAIKGICRTLAPNNYDEKLLESVEAELYLGFEFVRKHEKMVTVLGSAVDEATAPYYERIRDLTHRIVEECHMTIATGGGPGAMRAANHGAFEVDPTKSIAMGIELPKEQHINEYVHEFQMFKFFFTRKVMMAYTADAFIVCPGGFGTFDELFEMLTLQQTHKANPAPIILFDTAFWKPMYDLIVGSMEEKGFINPHDENLFMMTDSVDDIIALFKRLHIKA